MHYQPRDRSPLWDFGFWEDTPPVWHEQGLPAHIDRLNSEVYFGTDSGPETCADLVGVEAGLAPKFEEKVIEDLGEDRLLQQEDGVRVLRRKRFPSIPQPQQHLCVDSASWRKHYKPRLDPANPARYPADWDARVRYWTDPQRDLPLVVPGGSLYGWIRNWVGMENLALVLYDDPAWFENGRNSRRLHHRHVSRILATGAQFEACGMWRTWPTMPARSSASPLCAACPHYRRITDLLHARRRRRLD